MDMVGEGGAGEGWGARPFRGGGAGDAAGGGRNRAGTPGCPLPQPGERRPGRRLYPRPVHAAAAGGETKVVIAAGLAVDAGLGAVVTGNPPPPRRSPFVRVWWPQRSRGPGGSATSSGLGASHVWRMVHRDNFVFLPKSRKQTALSPFLVSESVCNKRFFWKNIKLKNRII